jgi:beta-1,4-N-acetylglucosaminyltransferase
MNSVDVTSASPPPGHETRSRVLLVASSGGHLMQLVQLKSAWPREERDWVTFDTPDAQSLLEGEAVTFAYHPTNRNVKNLIRNLGLAVRTIRRVEPTAIVSTGAGVAVPFCYVGRLLGARVIFIESFSRVSGLSLTGRLVYPIAHRFFVQWPDLAGQRRRAEYAGSLF